MKYKIMYKVHRGIQYEEVQLSSVFRFFGENVWIKSTSLGSTSSQSVILFLICFISDHHLRSTHHSHPLSLAHF